MQQTISIQPYIPFHIRLQLSQMDAHLDKSWHSTLVDIFEKHDPQVNNLICEQILKPKGIHFDEKKQCFINTAPRQSLKGLLPSLTAPQTRHLAQVLVQNIDRLAKETDIIVVGEYLEGILEQINQINTEDKPLINREKLLIKKHFLYDIDLIVSHNHYTVPKNSRNLTEHQIKSFICDVYIKNQLGGSISNSIRSQSLMLENSPIMDYVIEERKTRLFEVFEGPEYYYLITPSSHNEDPYSIRRFLYEEPSHTREFFYLNGIVIDKKVIRNSSTAQHSTAQHSTAQHSTAQNELNKIKKQIQCFVSINKSISPQIVAFIEKLDLAFQTKILPLIEAPLTYKQPVADRLFKLEMAIAIYLLQDIKQAIEKIAYSADDFEYLYIHSIIILSSLIFAYEAFQSQPLLLFNNQAKEFQYRILAWIKIVQKRKSEIFQHFDGEEDSHKYHQQSMKMFEETRDILNNAMKKIRQMNKTLKIKEAELKDAENANFFKRLFIKKENIEMAIVKLNDDIFEIKYLAFLDIIKLAKKYPKNTIYLEYENIIGFTDTHRHYAINMGDNGFTRLPILIKLPEDKNFFDLGETYQSIVSTFAIINQRWTLEAFEKMNE